MGLGDSAVRRRAGHGYIPNGFPQADGAGRHARRGTAAKHPDVARRTRTNRTGTIRTIRTFRTSRTVMRSIPAAIQAVVPMLSVTLAALACMAAEAFREKDERMPVGGLGIVGLIGAAISAALLWNGNTVSFTVISGDNFGLFVTLVLVVVGILTIMFSSQVIDRDGIPAGE